MKIERTKNAMRNIVFGGILKMYSLAIPFLMRTLMIYFMGVEYLGLNSLFTSILQVLNLAELGVGSAMVYSMYKPIAEDDTDKICALMKLYRTFYRIIGAIIACAGLLLLFFLPNFIEKDSLNKLDELGLNIYILYLLNLGATVLTYWLFAYKNCLLSAHQRVDVASKISLIVTTIQYALQIIIICFIKNYYLYLIVALSFQILNNITTAIIVNRIYPKYKAKGILQKNEVKDIFRRIKDLFTSKIGGVIVNSSDTIVISSFLGLTVLAVYQNYFYLITAVIGVVGTIHTACTAGIGNSIIVETREKNFYLFKRYTFVIAWIAGVSTVCFLCLFQPFMRIWMNGNGTLLLGDLAVIFLCIYFFVYEITQLLCVYKDAAGMWHEDRFRPLIVSFANIGLNLALVQFWGIYGVLFSTFITFLAIGIPWLIHNLFTVVFEKKYIKEYLLDLLIYTILTIGCCVFTYFLCWLLPLKNDWVVFIVRFIICILVPNIVFCIALGGKQEFKWMLGLLNRFTKGKIKFLRKY